MSTSDTLTHSLYCLGSPKKILQSSTLQIPNRLSTWFHPQPLGLLPACAADGRIERRHAVPLGASQPRQPGVERLAPLAAAGAGAEGSGEAGRRRRLRLGGLAA